MQYDDTCVRKYIMSVVWKNVFVKLLSHDSLQGGEIVWGDWTPTKDPESGKFIRKNNMNSTSLCNNL